MIHDFFVMLITKIQGNTKNSIFKTNNKYLFDNIVNNINFNNLKFSKNYDYKYVNGPMSLHKIDYSDISKITLSSTNDFNNINISSLKNYSQLLILLNINIKNPPLNIYGLRILGTKTITNFSIFQKLTQLIIVNYNKHTIIRHLPNLKILALHKCPQIVIGNDINVNQLAISRCASIGKINMSKLRILVVRSYISSLIIGKDVKYLSKLIWYSEKFPIFENKNIVIKNILFDRTKIISDFNDNSNSHIYNMDFSLLPYKIFRNTYSCSIKNQCESMKNYNLNLFKYTTNLIIHINIIYTVKKCFINNILEGVKNLQLYYDSVGYTNSNNPNPITINDTTINLALLPVIKYIYVEDCRIDKDFGKNKNVKIVAKNCQIAGIIEINNL